jgi:hypothetical protein
LYAATSVLRRFVAVLFLTHCMKESGAWFEVAKPSPNEAVELVAFGTRIIPWQARDEHSARITGQPAFYPCLSHTRFPLIFRSLPLCAVYISLCYAPCSIASVYFYLRALVVRYVRFYFTPGRPFPCFRRFKKMVYVFCVYPWTLGTRRRRRPAGRNACLERGVGTEIAAISSTFSIFRGFGTGSLKTPSSPKNNGSAIGLSFIFYPSKVYSFP